MFIRCSCGYWRQRKQHLLAYCCSPWPCFRCEDSHILWSQHVEVCTLSLTKWSFNLFHCYWNVLDEVLEACFLFTWLVLVAILTVLRTSWVQVSVALVYCVVLVENCLNVNGVHVKITLFYCSDHSLMSEVDNDKRTCLHAAACGG